MAAIAHYQFATIHPYYDGNGRTARLLTTLILHLRGYDFFGRILCQELTRLLSYDQHWPSHNYYLGRAESDITGWIEYFVKGMVFAFEKGVSQMVASHNKSEQDHSALIRTLDPKQRKALELFQEYEVVASQ